MKRDIASFAIGARVDKVFMPSRYELVFTLRTRAETRRLFLSVGGNAPRLNFTVQNPENPAKPPMICMLFRKLLVGAVLQNVRQLGLDRTLFFDFAGTNEIGEPVKYTLVTEIMAQNSNCILLDGDGVIIDALKRVDSAKSSFRQILPRLPFRTAPAQEKADLEKGTAREALKKILSFREKQLSGAILAGVSGVSPLLAKELAYRVTLGDCPVSALNPAQAERLCGELAALAGMIASGVCEPCYLRGVGGELLEFSCLPLTCYGNAASIERASDLSSMLDLFYAEREKLLRARSKAEDLYRLVTNLVKRTAKRVETQRAELPSQEDIALKKKYAELITANLYALPGGASFYDVPDYYDGYATLRVPASPMLTPSENAQKYYKEYRKLQTGLRVLTEQIEAGLSELSYLTSVQDALTRAETQAELDEIRAELAQGGFIKRGAGPKAKQPKRLPPLVFETPNGNRILVGRNNLQNDELTFKLSPKSDYWFHVKQAPGSHVVLHSERGEYPEADMELAAKAAAWFSSVRDGGSAEVDYTQIRNLKKPPGARPGFVIYHVYRTVNVPAKKPETI